MLTIQKQSYSREVASFVRKEYMPSDLKGLSFERIKALKSEIAMSLAFNREELEPILQENLQRYIGTYVPAYGNDWDIVLNEIYPIVQNNLPTIFFRNPRAFLKPRNKTFIIKKRNPISGVMEETQADSAKSAKTQEDILNYTIFQIKYKKEAQKWLLDALLFPHAILWHGYKGEFGMTEEQSMAIQQDKVFVKRINPMRFIHDPAVNMSNLDEGRWQGRVIDVPLQDLIEDDKLDVDKKLVKGYKGFGESIGTASVNAEKARQSAGAQDYIRINAARKSMIEYADKDFQNSTAAKFVKVFEVFLRPTKAEAREGKRGWILLLTDEQNKPLRVNEWTIKAKGFPGHILQFNELPDSSIGLSDIETYKQIADQKNVIVNLQLRNAQENSKLYVALAKGNSSEEEIEQIRQGDQTVIAFDGDTIEGKMKVFSGGGAASSELYLIDQRIDRNLQDKSGVTDLKKGFLQSGEESAASVNIRAAGGGARPAYRQDIMSDALKESFHYINQLNKQFLPIDDAVRIVGSLDLEWSEKPTKEEIQTETDVEIDVISMLPENPDKEIQELQTILQLMVEGLTQPQIAQKIAQEGKTITISPIIEQLLLRLKIKDPDVFRNIKPEESQGFVSVEQVREAKANVQSALTQQHGTPVPFPPKPTDDHVAKLEVYTAIAEILQQVNHVSDTLNQLIQIQSALLQQKQEEDARPGNQVKPSKLRKPVSTGV